MASRKVVPMPRPRGSAPSAARSVAHPGAGGAQKPAFVSPFQPPPAVPDLAADMRRLSMDDFWHSVLVAGQTWRFKVADPVAIALLAEIAELSGGPQLQATARLLRRQMHDDDFVRMVNRMSDPGDEFGHVELMELYRHAVTVGTARPFELSSASRERLRTAGA